MSTLSVAGAGDADPAVTCGTSMSVGPLVTLGGPAVSLETRGFASSSRGEFALVEDRRPYSSPGKADSELIT